MRIMVHIHYNLGTLLIKTNISLGFLTLPFDSIIVERGRIVKWNAQ